MQASLFDSKFALGVAATLAATLGVAGVVYWQRLDAPVSVVAAHAQGTWETPIGPGLLNGPVREPPAFGLDPALARDPQLAIDPAGHLVPNLALRALADSFLVKVSGNERRAAGEALRALLKNRLAAPAAQDAQRIVTDYLAYLDTEEQMLARERFPAGQHELSEREVEQLLAWQGQRAQLRQRLLGNVVAQAWFELEDASCEGALRDWQQQRALPDPNEEPDSNALRERRLHGEVLDARRDYNAQACAAQIGGRARAAPRGRQ
jgi:hypothetical protein